MKIRTHCNMARLAMNEIEKTLTSYKLPFYKKILFYMGTMEPDFSIKQFIYPHYYVKSSEYVYKKIQLLKDKAEIDGSFMFEFGKVVHYFDDFCCYVHRTGDAGNIQEHMVYERKINKYLLKKRKEIHMDIKDRGNIETYNNMVDTIETILGEYKMAEPSCQLDIDKSIEISIVLYNFLNKGRKRNPQNAYI